MKSKLGKEKVYVYHYNTQCDDFTEIATEVKPTSDGYYEFNMSHNEEKKVEFNIEFFKWGTNECLYSSKKMTFTLWYHFNFLSKNKFEVRTQKCLP